MSVGVKFFRHSSEIDEAVRKEGKLPFVKTPFEVYRQTKAISQSSLIKMKQSPSKFKWDMDHPRKSSDAQIIGSAIHCALLEPDKFDKLYAPVPKFDRRTKLGKEAAEKWAIEHESIIPLQPDDMDTINRVLARASDSEFFMQFFKGGLKEISFFVKDEPTGLILRGRLDNFIYDKNVIVDLKTTDCADEYVFNRDIRKYCYDHQAAYYMDLLESATGTRPDAYIIVAIEKSADCDINVFTFDDSDLKKLSLINRQWLTKLSECINTNKWPGYEQKFIEYRMPEYLTKSLDNLF